MFPKECFASVNGVGTKSKCLLWGFSTTSQPTDDPKLGRVLVTYPVAMVQDILTGRFFVVYLDNLSVLPEIDVAAAKAEINGFNSEQDPEKHAKMIEAVMEKDFILQEAMRIIQLAEALALESGLSVEREVKNLLKR